MNVLNKRKILNTDHNLLNTAHKYKKNCILITDDRIIRQIAKANKIKKYTTPLFIAYMLKKDYLSFDECKSILNKLKPIYIRPKDIKKVEENLKKWK